MKKSKVQRLRDEGFDLSAYDGGKAWRVRCSRCEAAVINGHACHETNCPNRLTSLAVGSLIRIVCVKCLGLTSDAETPHAHSALAYYAKTLPGYTPYVCIACLKIENAKEGRL